MAQPIRVATPDDSVAVAALFTEIYEAVNGMGSTSAVEMHARTVGMLFPEPTGSTTVYVFEYSGRIIGAAGISGPDAAGVCELLTLQVHDTVQGRGVAQTLLHRIHEHCADVSARELVTSVPAADLRARGFLSREGFAATETDLAGVLPDAVLRYRRLVSTAAPVSQY